jgi:hypothetical protein
MTPPATRIATTPTTSTTCLIPHIAHVPPLPPTAGLCPGAIEFRESQRGILKSHTVPASLYLSRYQEPARTSWTCNHCNKEVYSVLDHPYQTYHHDDDVDYFGKCHSNSPGPETQYRCFVCAMEGRPEANVTFTGMDALKEHKRSKHYDYSRHVIGIRLEEYGSKLKQLENKNTKAESLMLESVQKGKSEHSQADAVGKKQSMALVGSFFRINR